MLASRRNAQVEFDDVLIQILELLRRQKRVSYRALKLRFKLDDDYLEALKDEIIKAQRLAVDEDNTVLVWTGETDTPPEVVPQSTQPQEIGRIQPDQPYIPQAERRQLTVMFCDLADSTRLASVLDPEDLREVIRAYQHTCAVAIQRFDGSIAQYLGDGLLVYFGWPQAHEDGAQRAVRTSLAILDAMEMLHARLHQEKGIHLAVRIGIHTGPVVMGEMGSGGRHEQLALGETPNIAARLQSLTELQTAAMSAATSRIVQGYFTCADLGPQTLKGVDSPVRVYRSGRAVHKVAWMRLRLLA